MKFVGGIAFGLIGRDSNGNINCIFSVVPNTDSSVVTIGSVFIKTEVDSIYVEMVLNELVAYIKKIMINRVNKIRINYIENTTSTLIFIAERCGFIKECELVKEMGDKSLYLYSKFI